MAKGFLDFPPEIRLMIYEELLVSRKRYRKGWRDSKHKLWLHPTRTTRSCGDRIWDTEESSDKNTSYPDSRILRTCRTIFHEATPILYRGNNLVFRCTRSWKLRGLNWGLREYCGKIFSYSAMGKTKPDIALFFSFDFVAFLHRIGPANTAQIRSLRFVGMNGYEDIVLSMPIITRLVSRYIQQLQSLEVWAQGKIFQIQLTDLPLYWRRSLNRWGR